MHIRTSLPEPVTGLSGESLARRRLGAAIRKLQHGVVGRDIDIDEIHSLADIIETASGDLDGYPMRRRPPSTWSPLSDDEVPSDGDILDPGYDDRPFGGWSSPFSLELDVVRQGDRLVTNLVLGAAHEGAPGRSHGGIVAALFDDLTGFVLQLAQVRAFTGELKVRYEKPVPLGIELQAAAWLREHSGRKLYIDGELRNGDVRIATVETIYISVADF